MTATSDVAARLRQLLADGQLDLPLPGAGNSPSRLLRLHDLCVAEDVSVGRLLEAQCDAAAILAEAGRTLPHGALAGVWASRYGGTSVRAIRHRAGWKITGTARFCSGASIVDVALIDVATDDDMQLVVVPLRDGGVVVDLTEWRTPALAATATASVHFDVGVGPEALVGERNFYLRRPGFWHGSIGVAACWAGCARGVVEATRRLAAVGDPHVDVHLGEAMAACWSLIAVLERAGRRLDEHPADVGLIEALTVRHVVAIECLTVLESCRRAAGAGPLAFDEAYARRHADLRLYLQQHHFETDLAHIGAAATADRSAGYRATSA